MPRNVADAVRDPTPQHNGHGVWTFKQPRAFIAGVAGARFEAAFALAITYSLRGGGLFGLKWEDVDPEAKAIQIRRTRQRIRRTDAKEGEAKWFVVDSTPKTKKGARLVVLPEPTAAALRKWQHDQKIERLLHADVWQETGYVFTYQMGTAIEPNNFHHEFVNVVRRLDLPRIRPHDLRHT